MEINLLPQEQSGKSKFDGEVYLTRGFQALFEEAAITVAINTLSKISQERVNSTEGADYLQVIEHAGTRFWVINDVTHVTLLLPEEY